MGQYPLQIMLIWLFYYCCCSGLRLSVLRVCFEWYVAVGSKTAWMLPWIRRNKGLFMRNVNEVRICFRHSLSYLLLWYFKAGECSASSVPFVPTPPTSLHVYTEQRLSPTAQGLKMTQWPWELRSLSVILKTWLPTAEDNTHSNDCSLSSQIFVFDNTGSFVR